MKYLKSFGLVLAATVLLAGCASGPGFKESGGDSTPVAANSGRIYFYRTAVMGAAVQPAVNLNGAVVGSAVPQGYFFADRPPGDYEVTTTTEVKRALTFHLDAGQTRYVRLNISMGFMVGHVYPELVDESVGKVEILKTKAAKK